MSDDRGPDAFRRAREEVVRGVAVISKERFTELVLQYERLVYTVCFQLVRDAAAAEDLTQETFLSAYIHREAMPEGYERQWLSRVAANKAKDHLQSAWNRRTVLPGEEELARGLAPPAEEAVLRRSELADIQRALRELKEPYRQVCRLCLMEERSPEEAAASLGRPVKTVYTQLSRGKKLLREALERSGRHGIP
nr:sigma-70 family RNA polymerase sigma factor [uncultured Oscillibacter sp.]